VVVDGPKVIQGWIGVYPEAGVFSPAQGSARWWYPRLMDIAYLRSDVTGLSGEIGMMSAPGLQRALASDLDELQERHPGMMLVSLVNDQELEYLRITDLVEQARTRGIEVVRFGFGDHSTPSSVDGLIGVVARILAAARGGRAVIVHCWAGLGRTGLVAASCLAAQGLGAEEAIAAVRQQRSRAIENSDQEEHVAAFAEAWRGSPPAW